MAFTGYKALDFSGITKAIDKIGERQSLAALGQGLDGTPEGYAKAAQALLQRGDTAAAANFFALGEKARERTSNLENDNRIFQGLGLSGGGPMGAPRSPVAPAIQSSNSGAVSPRGVVVAETPEAVARLESQSSGLTQLGNANEPRGLRNNNPGNIESGRFAATVQGFQGSDGRFAQYATPEQGIQAADKLLTSYAGRGLNTVNGIVNRWAPPTENNTGAYVAQVAKELGVDPNQPLDMNNWEVRQKLIAAKIRVENGKQPYSEDVFQRALNPNWRSEVAAFEGGAQPNQTAQAGPQFALGNAPPPAGQFAAPQPAQVAQAAPPAGQRGAAPIPGDNPIQLRQEAQAYAQTNPEAARQMIARAEAIEQAAGVQTAQAGVPDPAMPAPGASLAQGFVIPGTGEVVPVETIANNPRLRNLAAAIPFVKDPAKRAGLENMFKLELEATKERMGAEGRELDVQNKRLTNRKLEQELGDTTRPLTAKERLDYGISPDQPAHMTKSGPKYGPAPTKIINEAQKLQSAEDKARVDTNTKFIGKLADSGPQVSQRMADMDVLASVIRDAPDTPTADVQVFFDRIGAGLGFSKGELATRSDAMKAIIQRLAPAQREEGSGSTSDIEFKGMLASFPSLATTKEGRQMILTTIARQNELTRMRIEVANEWAQGDIPATEARKKIAQIDRSSIYASEDEKKLIRKLAGTAKGGDLGRAAPAMEREVGGQIYVQRDGQWYPKGAN
jgi:hypothetical protein